MASLDPNSPEAVEECESVIRYFETLYLTQIPRVIQDGTAFISFHSMFATLEGLAGYRYGGKGGSGERFRNFVTEYLPPEYRGHEKELWALRNGMLHAFCPRKFQLTHWKPQLHLVRGPVTGELTLNAESFYLAIVVAARRYFDEVRKDPRRRTDLLKRSMHGEGGAPLLRQWG